MAKKKSLDDRLARAAELCARARVHYDLYRFLHLKENLDRYEEASIQYFDFFRFDRLAHDFSFIVRINNLLARKPDTDNLPDLLDEMISQGAIDPQSSARAASALDRINAIRKSVKLLRNKAVAHQDDTLSSPEIYAVAQVTLDQFMELSDVSLEVANMLCAARGLPPQRLSTLAMDALVRLLNDIEDRNRKCIP